MNAIALLLMALAANDPFRFEPTNLPKPVELPTEETPADQTGNAATGASSRREQEVLHAPADPRPVVYLYTSAHCSAGDQMRAANARGEFVGLNVVEREPPEWYTLCPTFHWNGPDGRAWLYPRDGGKFTGVKGMLDSYDRTNPGARFKAVASRGAEKPSQLTSASPFDQIQKFTGTGGKFTFVPDSPINASLDDRTSLKFSSIQGRYTVSNGIVTLKLDPPLPVGEYRKWLRFGFQITGAAGPENVTATTADVTIQTNRGNQKVTIQMEPAK